MICKFTARTLLAMLSVAFWVCVLGNQAPGVYYSTHPKIKGRSSVLLLSGNLKPKFCTSSLWKGSNLSSCFLFFFQIMAFVLWIIGAYVIIDYRCYEEFATSKYTLVPAIIIIIIGVAFFLGGLLGFCAVVDNNKCSVRMVWLLFSDVRCIYFDSLVQFLSSSQHY